MKSQFTKSNYKNQVGVDHFYVGFTKEEIKDLRKLAKLPCCSFSRMKSGRDEWQGVYWSSTHSTYFEMVESVFPGEHQFGLAMSANAIQYCDVRRIKKFFMGDRRMKSMTRTIGRHKWFEAISSAKKSTAVYMWAMHYFFFDRTRKVNMSRRPSLLERFTELELAVNPKFLSELTATCYWVPMRKIRKGSVLELEFKNKDKSVFKLKCNIDPKVEFSTFMSLRAQASPFQLPLPVLKTFELKRSGGDIILRKI